MKLVLDQLAIGYETALCAGINLTLDIGLVHVLLGDNGLGKTTLFKTITGVLPALMGEVKIENDKRAGVAFVGTDRPQVDFLSVEEYLSFGLEQVVQKDTLSLLKEFDAYDFYRFDVSELSDGQFKKIALVRQLLKQKAVLLLDEPSAYLDLKNKELLIDKLQGIKREQVVMLSTHDADFANKCGDRFYRISTGKLLQVEGVH